MTTYCTWTPTPRLLWDMYCIQQCQTLVYVLWTLDLFLNWKVSLESLSVKSTIVHAFSALTFYSVFGYSHGSYVLGSFARTFMNNGIKNITCNNVLLHFLKLPKPAVFYGVYLWINVCDPRFICLLITKLIFEYLTGKINLTTIDLYPQPLIKKESSL